MADVELVLDREVCIGAGQCELVAAGLFELDGDGIVTIIDGASAQDDLEGARLAADRCPSGAIRIEEP